MDENKLKQQSNKKHLLNLSDSALNKAVKIGGTDYDRGHKLTKAQIETIQSSYRHGHSISDIARWCKVSPATIKYHVDESFKETSLAMRSQYAHKSYSQDTHELASYKRSLINQGLI